MYAISPFERSEVKSQNFPSGKVCGSELCSGKRITYTASHGWMIFVSKALRLLQALQEHPRRSKIQTGPDKYVILVKIDS